MRGMGISDVSLREPSTTASKFNQTNCIINRCIMEGEQHGRDEVVNAGNEPRVGSRQIRNQPLLARVFLGGHTKRVDLEKG